MSSRTHYRFAIRKNSTKYYAINNTGNVIEQDDPYYLTDGNGNYLAPNGWKDTGVGDTRSFDYLGYVRKYGGPYTFYKDGCKILFHVRFKVSVRETPLLEIEELDSTSMEYKPFETVHIEMKSSQYTPHDKGFEVELYEQDIQGMIKDNENTVYTIPLTEDNSTPIECPPNYQEGRLLSLSSYPIPGGAPTSTHFPSLGEMYQPYFLTGSMTVADVVQDFPPISAPEANETRDFVAGQDWYVQLAPSTVLPDGNFIMKAETDLHNVMVKGKLAMYVKNDSGATGRHHFYVWVMDNAGNLDASPILHLQSDPIANGQFLNFAYEINTQPFALPTGKKVVFVMLFDKNGSSREHHVAWENLNEIRVDFSHYSMAFNVRGARIWRIADEVIKKMTNGKASLKSDMLKNSTEHPTYLAKWYGTTPYSAFITCGDSIRGVGTAGFGGNAAVKVKFSDLMNFIDTQYYGGFGVEGNHVVIEHASYFFNKNVTVAKLGAIKTGSIKIVAQENLIYNAVELGYEKHDYDGVNGRYEFNNGSSLWSLPGGASDKKLDLKTTWRTDAAGINNTWSNYSPTRSKDSKSDNDVFVIDCVWDGVKGKHVPRKQAGSISGVPDPATVYNIAYSPKHKLWRNGSRLRVGLVGMDDSYIEMLSADCNRDLYINFGYGPANYGNEDYLVKVSQLNSPLYVAEAIELTVSPPQYYHDAMNNATLKWGKYDIEIDGAIYHGFPVDTALTPYPNKEKNYVFYVSEGTDLTRLKP